jgi:hypothetical protein
MHLDERILSEPPTKTKSEGAQGDIDAGFLRYANSMASPTSISYAP